MKERVVMIIERKRLLRGIEPGYKKMFRLFKIVLLLVYSTVPFLSNYISQTNALCVWFPCAIYIFISTAIEHVKKDHYFENPVWEYAARQGEFSLLLIFPSVFVFNYYEIDYMWCWVVFISLAIYIPVFFVTTLNFDFRQNVRSDEEKRKAHINGAKHICYYWLFDLLFCSCFNNWNIMTYILGTIVIVIIFCNATKVFLGGNELFWWSLPFEFLIGISLSVYLIFSISNTSLRQIILSIVAALYSGLFTLIGVAWTIKKGETDRQEDMRRIEIERCEEERKKYVPFLKIVNGTKTEEVARVISLKGIDFDKLEDVALLKRYICYEVTIKSFDIKNISKEIIILKGVVVHGVYHSFLREVIIEPGGICRIETTKNYSVVFAELDKMMTLVVEDILGNQYSVGCRITLYSDSSRHIVFENELGKYTGFCYSYIVESVELPNLIDVSMKNVYDKTEV